MQVPALQVATALRPVDGPEVLVSARSGRTGETQEPVVELFAENKVFFSDESLALARSASSAGAVHESEQSSWIGEAAGSVSSAAEGEESREAEEAASQSSTSATGDPLTEEERAQVEKLRARDAEVRAHEAAHMAAGGAHVRGGATYSYQTGPDGKAYAIGGEVGIDVSAIPGNPQATIQKMQQVRAAALAPAEPSGADRAVAAAASQAEAKARQQLAEQAAERAVAAYGASASVDSADRERSELDIRA